MKIIIPGGSGQVGQVLARHYHARGDEVVVLGRTPSAADGATARVVAWDAKTLGSWAAELDGADVVINLAGRNVNCRYSDANRREIMDSRVESTRVVGQAIAAANNPPRLWLQASTATIYAHRYDAPNDEDTGIVGGDEPGAPDTWRFSIAVAKAWEEELARAANLYCDPPHPEASVNQVIKSLRKKDYKYKCKDEPMKSCCDSILCRKRTFGVPGGDDDDMVFAYIDLRGEDMILILAPTDDGWRIVGVARQ